MMIDTLIIYGGNACDQRGANVTWFDVYGSRTLDDFGRITDAKVLSKDNAWNYKLSLDEESALMLTMLIII